MAAGFGAFIGSNVSGAGGVQSINITTSGTVPAAAGNRVVVGVGYWDFDTNANPVVSGGGLSWSEAVRVRPVGTDDNYTIALWTADASSGLSSGATITCGTSPANNVFGFSAAAVYLTGIASSSFVDQSGGNGGSGAVAQVVLGTTTQADEVVCMFAMADGTNATWTPDTANSYTEDADFQQSSDVFSATFVHRVVSSTGAYTPKSTCGGGSPFFAVAASFKGASTGDATVDMDAADVTADGTGDIPNPTVTGDPTVDFDAKSRSHASDALGHTAASAFNWTHTPVGTPKGVLVAVTQPLGSTDEVSGVTYGGVAMTRVVSQARTSTEQMRVYLYFLGSSIPTGAQTVAVTSTGTTAKQAHAFTVTTSNGADTTVDASNSADQGIVANPSLTVTHTGTLPSWFGLAIHGYGGAACPNLTASSARQSNTTLGFGHDPGAATAETYYRTANAAASSSTYGYTTLASDDQVLAAAVLKVSAANATVDLDTPNVTADATGDHPDPTLSAGANVTAPVADATGDMPDPIVGALAQVISPAADGTGDMPNPTVSAGANVDAPVSDASGQAPISGNELSSEVAPPAGVAAGDAPAPTVSGSAAGTVTSPAADGTGDMPDPTISAGASVVSGVADATGDQPDPTVSAGVGVTSPAADGTGDIPDPSLSAGADVTSPVADGAGDAPAPSPSAGASVDATVADATGDVPEPTLIPAPARIRLGETVTAVVEVSARATSAATPAPVTGISEIGHATGASSTVLTGVVEPVHTTGVVEPAPATGVNEVFSNTGILEVAI